MTDNVDIFKKVIFRIPETWKTLLAIMLSSALFSALIYAGTQLFTFFNTYPYLFILLSFFGFFIPSVLSGELYYRFLPDYTRRWGYFLALCSQLILSIYGLIITGADNFVNAWNIFWLALASVYMANLLVLLLTLGYEKMPRVAVLSAVQPLVVLLSFHVFIGARVSGSLYADNLLILAGAGFALAVAFGVAEYLIRANLDNVSVLGLTAGLLQKKQEKLDLGYPTRPEVQTLGIENASGELEVAVPWIHPGPLEGFGGGRITSNIIEELNSSGQGFFFHVPSTHKSDPTDPRDHEKILEAMEKPEKSGNASKLVQKDYGDVKFYGRRLGQKKIVFMEMGSIYDDFELSVFKEILELDEVLLVDLHNHPKDQERQGVWYNTEKARKLRESLRDFLKVLEEEDQGEYRSGFSVDADGKPVFSMIEEVEDQRTLLIGVEGNGVSEEIRDMEFDDFDQVLLFSTDTHLSIHELSRDEQIDISRAEEAVKDAREDLSEASIGFSVSRAEEMKLLQEDYSGLIFSINILVRLIALMLLAVYIWLIYWVFF